MPVRTAPAAVPNTVFSKGVSTATSSIASDATSSNTIAAYVGAVITSIASCCIAVRVGAVQRTAIKDGTFGCLTGGATQRIRIEGWQGDGRASFFEQLRHALVLCCVQVHTAPREESRWIHA